MFANSFSFTVNQLKNEFELSRYRRKNRYWGYSAYVPDLPGYITVGNSKKEIESNIPEAILLYLEGIKEDGIQIPNNVYYQPF